MIKCLFCDAILRQDTHAIGDLPFIRGKFSHLICKSGHYVCIENLTGNVTEQEWYKNIPGRLSHLRIFNQDKNKWKSIKISMTHCMDRRALFEKYTIQQAQKRIQISFERHAWLLCAIRLGLIKDVRVLIGKYLSYEPFIFWKRGQ